MVWVVTGIVLGIFSLAVILITKFDKSFETNFSIKGYFTIMVFAVVFLFLTIGTSSTPEFTFENVERTAENDIKIHMSDEIVYIDGFGSYILLDGYLLSLENDKYYKIHSLNDIFDGNSEDNFYIAYDEDCSEAKLLEYKYRNTASYCNWNSVPIQILVIPTIYEK